MGWRTSLFRLMREIPLSFASAVLQKEDDHNFETAFAISPNLFITNAHNLRDVKRIRGITIFLLRYQVFFEESHHMITGFVRRFSIPSHDSTAPIAIHPFLVEPVMRRLQRKSRAHYGCVENQSTCWNQPSCRSAHQHQYRDIV